jgi:hypothetical protein
MQSGCFFTEHCSLFHMVGEEHVHFSKQVNSSKGGGGNYLSDGDFLQERSEEKKRRIPTMLDLIEGTHGGSLMAPAKDIPRSVVLVWCSILMQIIILKCVTLQEGVLI